jgi:DNA-binding ferritin-like protein (Dps family)
LFNISSTSQWATSNRFLFSILDKVEVYNSANYHISEEYKDHPIWEDQFSKYMDAIKENPRVDVNRLEMPYSISSYFWWGCNKRVLTSIIELMKTRMPFFYEVYGKSMLDVVGIDINKSHSIDSLVSRLLRVKPVTEEITTEVGDYIHITSKMGMILFSQFVRQAGSDIQGFYDELLHKDIEEFKNKLFKGSTEILISYMAPKIKFSKTISNRLCAFAMSSGDGPNSWNYIIKKAFPKLDTTIQKYSWATFP